jgi:hypothetical protein
MTTLAFGRLAGLHNAPTSPIWIAERLAWLPVFAAALAVLWALFARFERAPRARRGRPRRPPSAEPPAEDAATPAPYPAAPENTGLTGTPLPPSRRNADTRRPRLGPATQRAAPDDELSGQSPRSSANTGG